MTYDKELLLKDLSARLPYHVVVSTGEDNLELVKVDILNEKVYLFSESFLEFDISEIKPYLRPIHKLTEEELEELKELEFLTDSDYVDYCNKHHIDYCNLITKGLALEAPEGMY